MALVIVGVEGSIDMGPESTVLARLKGAADASPLPRLHSATATRPGRLPADLPATAPAPVPEAAPGSPAPRPTPPRVR